MARALLVTLLLIALLPGNSYVSPPPVFQVNPSSWDSSCTTVLYEALSRDKTVNPNLPPKNLKVTGSSNNPIRADNAWVQRWNEVKGLTETSLLSGALNPDVRADQSLELAYKRCEYVTQLFSKTFYTGTSLMRPDARRHLWAVYAWCRRTDDIVDSPRALLNRDYLNQDLIVWEERLEKVWRDKPVDLFDLALADTVKAYPKMSIQPYKDMIAGMLMDVPGMGKDRYENFDELYLYCYRVAGTVGLMTLPIFGTAEGSSFEEAAEAAVALGIGLQLTNILRDVGEDLERGRIYLPLDELRAFGLSEDDITSCKVTEKYKKFLQFQIQRARDYYRIAEEGVQMLHPSARFAVQASLDLYSRILNVIERNNYDNFSKRAFTTKLEKLSILPQSFMKAQSRRRS
eukprot:gene8219-8889_t